MILGLDLGRACGWAVLDADGRRLAGGTWRLPVDVARRLTTFGELLRELPYRPTVIAYEIPTHRYNVVRAVSMLIAVAILYADEVDAVPLPVSPAEAKATAGSGGFDKTMMISLARSRWACEPDEHGADALWLAETARRAPTRIASRSKRTAKVGSRGSRRSPSTTAKKSQGSADRPKSPSNARSRPSSASAGSEVVGSTIPKRTR